MTVLILLVMASLLIGAVLLGLWWGQRKQGKPEAGTRRSDQSAKIERRS